MSQIDTVGGWTNLVLVPYAPEPERRNAEIRIADRWVPVTLPYESGHRQRKDAAPSMKANSYAITCQPIPRLGSYSYLDYKMQIDGPGANFYTAVRPPRNRQRAYADGRPIPNESDRLWRVAPRDAIELEVEGGRADLIRFKVVVTVFDSLPIKVALMDGTSLYDPAQGVLPDYLGYAALEILDPAYRPSTWIVRDAVGKSMRRDSGQIVREVIGYKFRGSCLARFTLHNPGEE